MPRNPNGYQTCLKCGNIPFPDEDVSISKGCPICYKIEKQAVERFKEELWKKTYEEKPQRYRLKWLDVDEIFRESFPTDQ